VTRNAMKTSQVRAARFTRNCPFSRLLF